MASPSPSPSSSSTVREAALNRRSRAVVMGVSMALILCSVIWTYADGAAIIDESQNGTAAMSLKQETAKNELVGDSDPPVGELVSRKSAEGLNYLLYLPEQWTPKSEKKYPVIVFLHGRGESGGTSVMTEQSLPLQLKTNSTLRKAFPFIVILPSCPWSCAQKNEWQPNIMQRTTKVINEVATRYNGDFNRVSLAGQSMGGNGAWEYASSQKGLFSAVVAICGYLRSNLYEDHEIAKRLRLPIWVFHAENDVVIPVGASDSITKAIQNLEEEGDSGRPEMHYTRYNYAPGPPIPEYEVTHDAVRKKILMVRCQGRCCHNVIQHLEGHGSYELAFRDAKLFAWLREKRCAECVGPTSQAFDDWIHVPERWQSFSDLM